MVKHLMETFIDRSDLKSRLLDLNKARRRYEILVEEDPNPRISVWDVDLKHTEKLIKDKEEKLEALKYFR